jgi:hypothetical protein
MPGRRRNLERVECSWVVQSWITNAFLCGNSLMARTWRSSSSQWHENPFLFFSSLVNPPSEDRRRRATFSRTGSYEGYRDLRKD